MSSALVVGATGFVGRHVVWTLLDHGYDVAAASRGSHVFRFADPGVEAVTVDRTDPEALAAVARRVDPDVVVDCAAIHPEDVEVGVETFEGVDAYVYVSSGAAYRGRAIPKREEESPLHECTPEQAADGSMASYGPRKAEGDRIVATAAERGVAATSVRPTVVYGPQITEERADEAIGTAPWEDGIPASWAPDVSGIQGHHDYWIDRIRRSDRVVVPGDGTAIWHRAYVEDVAEAIRTVAERGRPGGAYNVGDRRVCTLEDVVVLIAEALDAEVEVVHASRRDLAGVGLSPGEFPLYHHPMTGYPHVLETCKLASLGWESTGVERAIERTVAECLRSGRPGRVDDPRREAEARLLDRLKT
ncbi:NAD-dependent epimerase/dehydratase family protein [Natronorarus salvus]|uniref:NAD-dependent epimerase/dehydratase family protein n=1 Tax=Natronorarus salvus TaxID=3117733 RepID=UPI002F264573